MTESGMGVSGADDGAGASQESNRRDDYREIVDLLPGLIATVAADGTVEVLNRRALDYFGAARDGLTQWPTAAVIHPDDVDRIAATWAGSVRTGEPHEIELRLRRSDGAYRWFLTRAVPMAGAPGSVNRWCVLSADIEDLRRSEQSARAAERAFREAVDTIPGFIVTNDGEGAIESVNKVVLDYTGMTADEVRDRAVVVHPDDMPTVMAHWVHSKATGEPFDSIERIRRADGVYRWFRCRGNPLRDHSGRIVRWYNLLTDIHDRKEAEDALRESELNLRQTVDTIPALVCTMNANGELTRVNRQIVEYFDLAVDQLKKWEFIGVVHEDDRERVIATWQHCVATGEPYNIEHRIRRADGVFRWFQVGGLPLRDHDDRIICWYVLLTDIEDRKRAEHAVRDSEARLRLILDTMPALVWSASVHGEIEYVNQRMLDYIGQLSQFEGTDWRHAIHPEDSEMIGHEWRHSIDSLQPFGATCRLRASDGRYRWFELHAEPLHDSDGRVVGWYGLSVDVHEKQRMLADLREARVKLSRAAQIATVAELSASIAHEINQPLASVVTNGHACQEWLSHQEPNVDRARLVLERIIRDAHSAAEVVQKIRALFKQAPSAKAPLDMNELIREVQTLLADEIRDKDVAVELHLAPSGLFSAVDRVQMAQTLINLIHNAVEAMDGVTDRPRELVLRSSARGAETLVEVCDRGCGLAHPISVFEPFFTTKETGMGMGLSISRSVIEAHGGRLWATPNDGHGVTFSFTIPLYEENAPAS